MLQIENHGSNNTQPHAQSFQDLPGLENLDRAFAEKNGDPEEEFEYQQPVLVPNADYNHSIALFLDVFARGRKSNRANEISEKRYR